MVCLCILALLFYVLWTPVVLYLAHNWFTKKYNFYHNMSKYTNPEYLPFLRHDRKNWNVVEFILVGIFLAPLRLVIIFTGVFGGLICNKILVRYYNPTDIEAEQPAGFIKIIRLINGAAAGLTLFGFGFRVNHYSRCFDSSKHPKLKQVPETDQNTTVVVSNHVSWADIVYFMCSPYKACFISKSEVKKYPIVGFYAKILQCIFVNREEAHDRMAVLNKLEERVKNICKGKNYNKLVIFPEGTTTNGGYLLSFKKGAFILKTPLKVLVLKYNGRVSPNLNMIGVIDSLISVLFQLCTRLDVYAVEGLIEPKFSMEWEEYAEAVRDLMANEFQLHKSISSFAFKKEIEGKVGFR